MTSLRLHWLLIIGSVVLPAALLIFAAMHSRSEVLLAGEDTVTRTADVLHEHAGKVLETGEMALAQVDDHIRNLSWREISAPETSMYLARIKAPMDQVASIWISDAQAVVRAGSRSWDPSTKAAGEEFSLSQQAHDAPDDVSGPFRDQTTQAVSFAISRRRSTADGHFDGVIHIAFSSDYFVRFFAEAAPHVPYTAVLLRRDGEVLARHPDLNEISARLGSDSPIMRQIRLQSRGFGLATSDGTERAYAYRKVGAHPVYVVFSIEMSVMLHRWHENLILFGSAAMAATLTLLLISCLALRSVQRERASLTQLSVTLNQLRHEKAQREIAEQQRHQAQKMEAIGQLTGGIAHDFNNLLVVMQGGLRLLRRRLPPGDLKAAGLLSNAMQAAERGAALSQRLLAFGRRQTLRPEPVDVSNLVGGISSLLRSLVGAGVQVETHFPSALASALVDTNQLELALLNLAGNARDAMAGTGLLRITAREEPADTGSPDAAVGAYVVLRVTDTGSGMDEATLARATEPFFTTKGVGKGTGLGLSMVRDLAVESGGRFVLHSVPGEGTTAELWLPRATAAAPSRTSVEAQAVEHASDLVRRGTVLIVDDDLLVQSSVSSMFDEMGHAVVEASSGLEALEFLRADTPIDLMVADQSMPGMTGTQLAAELRRLRPEVPVLLMTGLAERADVMASGLPLLIKPFDQVVLAKVVGRHLTMPASRVKVAAFEAC